MKTIDILQGTADLKGLGINFSTDCFNDHVMVDSMRTQQIIMNLLSNAIKFSKVDCEIKVKVKYEPVDKDNVFVDVHVIDKGIGINQEDQLSLFKAHFVTSDEESKSLNQQSHGIGLSICDKISNALGGTLSVKSELGKGATFTYRFKCQVIEVKTIDLESIRDKLHRE